MRRFVLPLVAFALVVIAFVLTSRADDAAQPDDPAPVEAGARLGTPVLSVRRAPEWLRQPTADNLLETEVLNATSTIPDTATHCAVVVRDGARVATTGSSEPLEPGQLARLATVAAFLEESEGTTFTTSVVRSSGVVTEGELEGELFLVGGADPVLSTNEFGLALTGYDYTSIEDLADLTLTALRADGIEFVSGAVLGDESKYFPAQRDLTGVADVWETADYAASGIGPLSALVVDNGFDADGGRVDPPLDAARRFQELLEAGGISFGRSAGTGDQPALTDQEPLADIESPAAASIAARAFADPMTAEMLYKEVGLRKLGASDNLGSLFGVGLTLQDAGLVDADSGFAALDGSGLTRRSRMSCEHLASILGAAGPDSSLLGAMPTAAQTAVADCAPTGTDLRIVVESRAGVLGATAVATASNGDRLGITLIINSPVDEATGEAPLLDPCDGVLPALLDAIDDHPHGPGLDEFVPLDVVEAPSTDS